MEPGHGSGTYAAAEPIAHDEVMALAQPLDEGLDVAEVVRVVGITHDDIATTGGRNARLQGTAVTTVRDSDHPSSVKAGDLGRAIRATVIGHDDLAPHTRLAQGLKGLVHATTDGASLVEARHNNRHIDYVGGVKLVELVDFK